MSSHDDAQEIAIGLRTLNNFTPFVPLDEPQLDTIECDWRTWLTTVGPKTFTREFSPFQVEYWNWYWRVTQKRRARIPLDDDELVALALWGRGLAKSSNVEWSAIGEGALIGTGYVLYVSGTQEQAEEHVTEIQKRLESEAVAKYYPGLGKPKISEHGNQYGWRQNFLLTESGWAIRPIGLKTSVRGGRVHDLRPTMIIFDDIDEVDDSLTVIERKITRISGSIIPSGTPDTLKLVAQNPIHKNSVVNQIYTRKIDVLSERTTIGGKAIKSFNNLQIETRQTKDGPRNIIVTAEPAWEHLDIRAAQRFLNDSGKERFLSEYQHDFSGVDQRRVIPEFDEAVHVITWDQFEAVFGVPYIPYNWLREAGHDIGYTRGHLSSWTFVATSGKNTEYPNLKFVYRGLNFCEPLLDNMALAVLEMVSPEERKKIVRWKMSHEKKGERDTYRMKYGLTFKACEFGKTDGIPEWRHYLRCDHSQPHPFYDDELLSDEVVIDGVVKKATWLIGCPAMFYVIGGDQRQFSAINDSGDKDLVIHRQQVVNWEYRRSVETDTGLSVEQPVKAREDSCDSTRMVTSGWGPGAASLTDEEAIDEVLPLPIKRAQINQLPPEQKGWAITERLQHIAEQRLDKRGRQVDDDEWDRIYNS